MKFPRICVILATSAADDSTVEKQNITDTTAAFNKVQLTFENMISRTILTRINNSKNRSSPAGLKTLCIGLFSG